MLKDIFEESSQHQYYKDLVRDEVLSEVREEMRTQALEEGRQEFLQDQRKTLVMIVRARFPKLVTLAKTQSRQIKDATVMNEVLGKVGAAQTTEEAINALISWLPDDDSEEE